MIASNFTAQLHCQHGQVGVADSSFSDHPFTSADIDGWLCTRKGMFRREAFKPVTFEFIFVKQTSNRLHYILNGADTWNYTGARLERSSEGWLGLYGTHVAGRVIDALNPVNLLRQQQTWSIETLQPQDAQDADPEAGAFILRDHLGHRVAHTLASRDSLTPGYFLNAGEKDGEILTFHLRNIQAA